MTITILHVSDTHGTFTTLPSSIGELVVHSGDMMPNASRGNRPLEYQFQTNWIVRNIETYREWLDGRTLLFCPGNHDFVDPCKILQEAGINAIDITNDHYEYHGIKFYGFPYINYIAGEWNYECQVVEMQQEIRRLRDEFQKGIDVLVCHAPLHGILDECHGDHIGNAQLNNLLAYQLGENQLPRWILCGHAHPANGQAIELGINISNAATTVHIIHL